MHVSSLSRFIQVEKNFTLLFAEKSCEKQRYHPRKDTCGDMLPRAPHHQQPQLNDITSQGVSKDLRGHYAKEI